MRTYSYNEEQNYYILNAVGDMVIDDVIGHYNNLFSNNKLPSQLKVLLNCTKADFNFEPIELKSAKQSISSAINKFKSVREAILVDEPYETAVAIMFESVFKEFKNYKFHVFSTENAALKWLLSE